MAISYNQKLGIHFHEIFACVAHIGSIRIMAGLAAKLGLKTHQLDVISAYIFAEVAREKANLCRFKK